nr:hypothetical protein CR513_38752 [Ipomoea batatas]GME11963.1 hypothetical protein CR513_38752 [Ipomoea batatas]
MGFNLFVAFSKPGVILYSFDCDSGQRVCVEDPGQEMFKFRRGPLGDPEFGPVDFPGMEPAVGSGLILHRTQPEIRHLQVPLLVQQQILGLEVAVVNAAGVTVINGGDQLLEILTAEIFAESALSNLPEKLPSLGVLHDSVHLSPGSEDFVEAHDMRVTQAAHDRNLPHDVTGETSFTLFADGFNRHVLPRWDDPGVIHLGGGPTTEDLAHLVLVEEREFGIRQG